MNLHRGVGGFLVASLSVLALTGLAGTAVAEAPAQQPAPIATIPDLTGKTTSVKLDSGFTSALESLQVKPGTIGSAEITDGSAVFPITGGNVTVYKPGDVDPYVQGRIEHDGSGLSLTKGSTKVELTDFVIDPGKPATLKGKVSAGGQTVAESATLFDLDGSTLKPITTDAAAGTATLTGTTVRLSADAASALNKAFSTDAVKGGLTVGIATIVVNLPGTAGGSGSGDMPMPNGGVETGGGSTAGTPDALLISTGGVLVLLLAGGVALVARRRVGSQR